MKKSHSYFILFFSALLFWGLNNLPEPSFNNNLKGSRPVIMEKIKGKIVQYVSGKDTVSAYLSIPPGKAPFPALIVIHEWWGLNDWVKKNSDDFAENGYAALAIDLYHGKSANVPDEARKLSGSVQQEQALVDLKSAFDYLMNLADIDTNNIGVIGWCMGGGYSLRAALNIPGLSACVINYGRLINDTDLLKKINCPVLGIFGEEDKGIPPVDVKLFEKSLNEAGIKNKIIIYPGVGHAFMNPANTTLYNEAVSEKAWTETYSFLKNNLMREHK